MRVLVFAHTPPPHHGQSVMVQLMIDGFGGDCRGRNTGDGSQRSEGRGLDSSLVTSHSPLDIQIYHVNARVSDDMADVGGIRAGKLLRLLGYCAEAIWCRVRYGVDTLYYVPAPAKRSAILRDWMVMLLVRPWFRRTVFHWHALGLGHWATGTTEYPAGPDGPPLVPPRLFGPLEPMARSVTRFLLGRADVSIALTEYNKEDAGLLNPRRIEIVPNGIPDPLAGRQGAEGGGRKAEGGGRRTEVENFRCLFLGHCMESKGLLTAVRVVAEYRKQTGQTVHLTVAGNFPADAEKVKFDSLVQELNVADGVCHIGFADEARKRELFMECDVLLFPTQYPNETFGLVVLEAMAFGVPALVSQWRGVPEVAGRAGCPDVESTAVELRALLKSDSDPAPELRQRFMNEFGAGAHLEKMREALLSGYPEKR